MGSLNEGRVPFFEAGLDPLVTDGICDGLLGFHADNQRAAEGAAVVLIALPTKTLARHRPIST